MTTIGIITLKPEEWREYKEIRLRSLRDEPQAYLSTYKTSSQEADGKWKDRLLQAEKGKVQWLSFAKKDGKIVGMVGAFREADDPVVEVISAFVAKEARSLGIGKILMDHLLDSIRKNKTITIARLEVNEAQVAAVNLYTSCGFKITGTFKRVLGDGKEYVDLTMEKLLLEEKWRRI